MEGNDKLSASMELSYCQVCIKAGEYEKARLRLIKLKLLNPILTYAYDYYMQKCLNKEQIELDFNLDMPLKEIIRIQKLIKEYLLLTDKKLKKEFLKNEDLFYFISTMPETNTKTLLLLKLSKLEGKPFNIFFKSVLLMNYVKTSTKLKIVKNRMKLESVLNLFFSKDDIIIKIIMHNKKLSEKYSPVLSKSALNCLNFILDETTLDEINLKSIVNFLANLKIEEKANEEMLSAYLTWSLIGRNHLKTLRSVCNYFNVTQENFYKFMEENNLDLAF